MTEKNGELLMALATADSTKQEAALRVLRGEAVLAVDQKAVPTVEPYLRFKQVAEALSISVCSLWRWQVPGHELGGRRRFKMSEVLAYLESDEFKTRAEELKQERRTASV